LTTRQKLLQFDWDVLFHPPYSPDIASSDFHLFRFLQNSLIGKKYHFFGRLQKAPCFLPIKLESSGRMKFPNCLKGGAKLLKKTVNTLLNKIIF